MTKASDTLDAAQLAHYPGLRPLLSYPIDFYRLASHTGDYFGVSRRKLKLGCSLTIR